MKFSNHKILNYSLGSLGLCLLCVVTLLAPQKTQAVGSPLDIIPEGLPNATMPFGGQILASLSCDTAATCLNPICLLVRCILQVPFTLHVFNNYALTSSQNAFNTLRDDVLEPKERQYCPQFCNALGLGGYCTVLCGGALPGLQAGNVSPVGIAVEGIKQVVPGGMQPSIVLVLFPVENPIPACQNFGFVTGSALGQGLFFAPNPLITGTKGTPLESLVGDSCRGDYFSPFPYLRGGL